MGERSITLALMIMSANIACIIGSQIFQGYDAPNYPNGWTGITVLVSTAIVIARYTNIQYWVLNKRMKKEGSYTETTRYYP